MSPSGAALPDPVDCLAFGPHPDDVELCAGGLILRLTSAGKRCAIVDFTRGERASRGTPQTRARETEAASRILGLAGRENLGLPDTRVEVTSEATALVVAAIRRWRPRLVVGPCPEDLHPDHVAAAALVERAYYLATIEKADGGGLPLHRADAVIHYFGHLEPTPTFVVDVTDVWERRMEAAACYASQLGTDGAKGPTTNLTSPEFRAKYEARFRYWGGRIGATYGEPFLARRVVPVDDPVETFRKRSGLVL